MKRSEMPIDLGQLAEEHGQLRHLLDELQDTFFERKASPEVVAAMLDEAIGNLQTHFQHEERDEGCFQGIVEAAPRLSNRVNALKSQHAKFIECLLQIRQCVGSPVRSNQWWDESATAFHQFLPGFLEHERAENELIQEAFSRDIGTDD